MKKENDVMVCIGVGNTRERVGIERVRTVVKKCYMLRLASVGWDLTVAGREGGLPPRLYAMDGVWDAVLASATEEQMRHDGKTALRIVVANDPRCYREVISAAIRELRPRSEVTCVEPGDLPGALAEVQPHLVLCSSLSSEVEREALAWMVLYPEGKGVTTISLGGQRMTVTDVEFDVLLSVIDETEQLLLSA